MCAIFPQGNIAIVDMLVQSSRTTPTPTSEGGPHFFAAAKSGVRIAKWPPAGGADSSEPKLELAA